MGVRGIELLGPAIQSLAERAWAVSDQQNVAKLKADARNLVNIFAAHSPTRPALQMADIARLRRRRAASGGWGLAKSSRFTDSRGSPPHNFQPDHTN
jgi:hypothetical protein